MYYQNSTARYVCSKRGCRGRREHSVNAVLTETSTTTTTSTTKPPTRPDTCDDGWQRFNGHCYLFVTQQYKTWDDALSYCGARSSYLLEITSDMEYEFVKTKLGRLLTNYGYYWYWTGGTDRRSQGTFLYHHSGEPVPNKYWATGQPDNWGGNEHCVGMYYSSSEYDGLCSGSCSNGRRRFVCEKS